MGLCRAIGAAHLPLAIGGSVGSLDPEAYLVDVIADLPNHPMKRIAELLHQALRNARAIPAAATAIVQSPVVVV